MHNKRAIISPAKLSLIASMAIFGTIGIFRKYIPLPSGTLAMFRGLIGALFLIIVMLITRKKPDLKSIKLNLILLIISGALIGFNWILLFEAYNYTSVATATLCYYMAPIFVIFASPIFLKEKLNAKKIVCALIALVGMILVSGIFDVGLSGFSELIGVFLGLGAAALYASVIILNRKLKQIGAFDKTLIQLIVAGVVLIPYIFIVEDISGISWSVTSVTMTVIVGAIHTGLAYAMYFGSIGTLKAQTVAIFSYIDPIVAIIFSTLLLKEKLSIPAICGAILILGATFISEINFKKVRSH